MKSRNQQIQYILLVLAFSILLSGCSFGKKKLIYDVGNFILSGVYLDEEELELSSVYPNGARISLCSDGFAEIMLGEEICKAEWTEQNGLFHLIFSNMDCIGELSDDILKIEFGNTGLTCEFTRGIPENRKSVSSDGNEITYSGFSGEWEGRLWFEDSQGEWSEYKDRSYAVIGHAELSMNGSEEAGKITLYNSIFSPDEPLMELDIQRSDNDSYSCSGGCFMSYSVYPYEIPIEISEEPLSDLRNTVIIKKPGDYGHVFTPDVNENVADNTRVPVIRLSGMCRDENGSFQYLIELVKKASE